MFGVKKMKFFGTTMLALEVTTQAFEVWFGHPIRLGELDITFGRVEKGGLGRRTSIRDVSLCGKLSMVKVYEPESDSDISDKSIHRITRDFTAIIRMEQVLWCGVWGVRLNETCSLSVTGVHSLIALKARWDNRETVGVISLYPHSSSGKWWVGTDWKNRREESVESVKDVSVPA